MDKVNPLHIDKLPSVSRSETANVRGRPTLKKIIKFSPQPKSIVSQMLNKIKSERSVIIEIGDKDYLKKTSADEEFSQNDGITDGIYESIRKLEQEKTLVPEKRIVFCDYKGCSYSCKLSCNLLKHKRTHTNDKPYLCDKCSFRSNYVNSLKSHKRIHTKERPYSCKHCTYRCNSSSNLKKHCLHRHPEELNPSPF